MEVLTGLGPVNNPGSKPEDYAYDSDWKVRRCVHCSSHIATDRGHPQMCFFNPRRLCPVCWRRRDDAVLSVAYALMGPSGGFRALVDHCPSCFMANVLRAAKRGKRIELPHPEGNMVMSLADDFRRDIKWWNERHPDKFCRSKAVDVLSDMLVAGLLQVAFDDCPF